MKRETSLTGNAGVYYVASVLAFKNLHAAITVGNAPYVDIIVSLPDGSASVALQVKTTGEALRTYIRPENQHKAHYEWDVGRKLALANIPDLFMVFVDLHNLIQLPDVFVVSSTDLHDWFLPKGELKRWRWHPRLEEAEPYKNCWEILEDRLRRKAQP